MTATPTRSPWDFSDAFQLLHTPTEEKETALKFSPSRNATILKRSSKLGDFSNVWRDLGTSPNDSTTTTEVVDFADTPALSNPAAIKQHVRTIPNPSLPPAAPLRDDIYASDGGYRQSARKTVTWKDQSDHVEATTDAPTSEDEPASSQLTILFRPDDAGEVSEATLAKAQRKRDKKQRQKEKKRMQQEVETPRTRKVFSDVESESEIKRLPRLTPASKASKHIISPSPIAPSNPSIQETTTQASAVGQIQVVAETSDTGTVSKQKNNISHKRGGSNSSLSTPSKSTSFTRAAISNNLRPTSVPQAAKVTPEQEISRAEQSQYTNDIPAHVPVTTTPNKSSPEQVSSFITPQSPNVGTTSTRMPAGHNPFDKSRPSLVILRANLSALRGSTVHTSAPHAANHNSLPDTLQVCNNVLISSYSKFQILEKEERDLQLFLRLIHEFSADKKWLTKPVLMANHNDSPKGLHIFVDFSNIWIGFMDHLKSLQLRMRQRIPHQNISFDALVLLLERKRPVAKRVLAGSYPLLPAMELAKQIGYETLILEKVYKARELNERQRRMLAMQSRNTFAPLGTQGSSPPQINPFAPTTPNTFTPMNPFESSTQIPVQPMSGPEKWVEQGVDEILHLKILESIVDSEEPSTMVVATGDAAKAEYSEGFMVMIRRALKKGWMVELVAFSKSISGEYWKRSFQEEWEGRFTILTLDQWAQYLLDT